MQFASEEKIKSYLFELGLFSSVTDIRVDKRRNLTVRFKGDSQWYLLKQKGDEHSVFGEVSLDHELAFYNKVSFDYAPKIKHVDTDQDLMIMRYYRTYVNMMEVLPEEGVAAEIGKITALLHTGSTEHAQSVDIEFLLPKYIFSPSGVTNGGPSTRQFIRLVQKFPDLLENLHELYDRFSENACIHGDLKFDNLLYNRSSNRPVKMIDFEFYGRGDLHYDLGYLLGSMLMVWIRRMELTESKMDYKEGVFEELRTAFIHMLKAYRQINDKKIAEEDIMKYAGLYLLKIIYNSSLSIRVFSKLELVMLQVARNYIVFSEKQVKSLMK